MSDITAKELIQRLELARHPEGGWFREIYRSKEVIAAEALPERYEGPRAFCTSIYFLLQRGDISALHRIKSDEIWYFHAGATVTIQIITPSGEHLERKLGRDLSSGASFQIVVPEGCWFGAEISGERDYSLVSCTVAPGFDFADFEMGRRDELLLQHPMHGEMIRRLTRE